MAGLEVELYITRLARPGIRFEETGQGEPGPAPEVEVFQRGYQFLSDVQARRHRRHARGDPGWALGSRLAAALDRGRVGAGPDRVHVRPDGGPRRGGRDDPLPQRGEGDLQPARAARVVHVLAGAPELLPLRLAPSPVARRRRARATNAFASDTRLLSAVGRHFVAGLLDSAPAMAVFGDPTVNSYARFRPYSFAPGPGHLGGRQPRRADQHPGRAGRSRHARREPARRARREPVPLARREHRRGPRRHRARRRAAADRHQRSLRRRGPPLPQSLGEAVDALAASERLPRSVRRLARRLPRDDEALRDRGPCESGRPERVGDGRVLRDVLIR